MNPAGVVKEKKASKKVIALYDFTAENPTDLTIKTNDVINVIEDGEEWIKGELNGQIGMLPANYVKPYEDEKQAKKPGIKRMGKELFEFLFFLSLFLFILFIFSFIQNSTCLV